MSVHIRAKAENLLEEYWVRGFNIHHCPLENEQDPSMETCLQLLEDLHTSLKIGNRVVIQ